MWKEIEDLQDLVTNLSFTISCCWPLNCLTWFYCDSVLTNFYYSNLPIEEEDSLSSFCKCVLCDFTDWLWYSILSTLSTLSSEVFPSLRLYLCGEELVFLRQDPGAWVEVILLREQLLHGTHGTTQVYLPQHLYHSCWPTGIVDEKTV